jgi:hypothetical protein
MQQLSKVWVLSVLVHFVNPKDGGVNVFHLAVEVQDVYPVGRSLKSIDILKVNLD